MQMRKFIRKDSVLYLGLRRAREGVRAIVLRRSPFFRQYPPKVDINMVDRRGAVCRSPAFIYFRIPKAANSTITLVLQGLLSNRSMADFSGPREAKALFAPLGALTQDEVTHLSEKFFTFTFVRNPFTRIASAYLDKICKANKQKIHVARWYDRPVQEPISFGEFCEYLRQGRGYRDDGHWARQCDLIPIPIDALDFIGRIESLEEDLRSVIAGLFGPNRELDIVSWPRGRTGASSRVRELYGPREMEIIREVYKDDFRAFGYNPDELF
jgi:hypothetical protein